MLDKIPRVVDNTILANFRTCNHKALWEFVHNLRPAEISIDLHAGTCFARAIEILYRYTYTHGEDLDKALARASFAFYKMWGDFEAKKVTFKTRSQTWLAVETYAKRFHPPTDYIEPSPKFADPFEYTFAIELTRETLGHDVAKHPLYDEPFIYAGRFDMIGEQYGALRIRDDKTTSRLGPTWAGQWTLRSQLMGYCAAMQTLGYPVDTCELRGVGILKNDITFETAVKTYTKDQLARWRRQIAFDINDLVECARTNNWRYNFGEACASYGGCAFMDLCRATTPEDYFNTYALRAWNPLVRQAETA